MCNDVNCRDDQLCTINQENVAVCMDKTKVLKKYKNKDHYKSSNSYTELKLSKCTQCPNSSSNLNTNDIYCASNNRTYSSLCELIRYNCEQSTDYYPICQSECPCNQKINLNQKLKLDYLWKKYVNNFQQSKKSDQKLNQELNKKLDKKSNRANRQMYKKICTEKELNEMGQRLFNWFGVILKNQLKNENLRSSKILNKIKASLVKNCDEEVNFMFFSLDTNKDLRLSVDELYHLEHDQREKCLKTYMDSCDSNGDQVLNNNEFCNCFAQYRPCYKERNNLLINKGNDNKLTLDYMPNCDRYGRFLPLQCSAKLCWCVDKNGNEIANTKKFGKVVCGKKSKAISF